MPTFEKRVVILRAVGVREALRRLRRCSWRQSSSFRNNDGNLVHIDDLGVMDKLYLGTETGDEEVWCDIVVRRTPMEPAKALLPPAGRLCALRNDRAASSVDVERARRPSRCRVDPASLSGPRRRGRAPVKSPRMPKPPEQA